MTRLDYVVNPGRLSVIEAALRVFGFYEDEEKSKDLRKSSATVYGTALQLGSTRATLLHVRGHDPALVFEGAGSALAPVHRFLSETRVPGTHEPFTALYKAREDVERKRQEAKEAAAQRAQLAEQLRRAEQQRKSQARDVTWSIRTVDGASIEARLIAAGWQMVLGSDGLPVWSFGSAIVAFREGAAAGMSIVRLQAQPTDFAPGYRLITSGSESLWMTDETREVRAEPIRKSKPAEPAEPAEQRRNQLFDEFDVATARLRRLLNKRP
jgi:hypothetical protein